SAAAATILTAIFGNNVSFTTDSVGLPGVQRTFSSFQAAADEAGRSRIYGGIHYQFSNADALATRRALGSFVLSTFSVATDTRPPQVTITDPQPGSTSARNVTVNGTVTDNLSGVQKLEVQVDGGAYAVVPVDTDGHFALPTT